MDKHLGSAQKTMCGAYIEHGVGSMSLQNAIHECVEISGLIGP